MKKSLLFIFIALLSLSCSRTPQENSHESLQEIKLDYALGFKIFQGEGYKVVEVIHGFPGDHKPFRYYVQESSSATKPEEYFNASIPLEIHKIILTSTTQVPHLTELGLAEKLVAFPNRDLISSKPVRQLIEQGKVAELGGGANFNSEKIIDISPDLLVISTLGDNLKDLQLLDKANIPAVINGDYMEQHPLGRAEWIKFTGALTGTLDEAIKKFEQVKSNYLNLKTTVKQRDLEHLPSVISGNMYKDIWYAPAGNNWGAIFLEDAGADYIFKDQEHSGSLQLNYEFVLDKGLDAEIWISTAEFSTLDQMKNADSRYTKFKAFQEANVYTFANTRGATGGLEYFELGYTRPDIILKDLIKIFHPELLPDYKPYFYERLK